jgi:hypothetical protein
MPAAACVNVNAPHMKAASHTTFMAAASHTTFSTLWCVVAVGVQLPLIRLRTSSDAAAHTAFFLIVFPNV